MTARSIVERMDVVGHLAPRQLSVTINLIFDPLVLQTAQEGRRNGVSQQLPFRLNRDERSSVDAECAQSAQLFDLQE